MARHTQDLALLLETQAGHDPRVPLSLPGGERYAARLREFEPKGQRIAWLGDLGGYLALEPGILEVCEQGLQRLQRLGCVVEPRSPGFFSPEAVWQAWLVWRRWLVAGRLAPYLFKPSNRALIKPEALWEADQAAGLSGAQTLAASIQRSAFYQQMLALFDAHCDFIALPATQVWPFEASQRWPQQINGRAMDTYHRWMEVTVYASFAGLPAISLPAGFGPTGLPCGLQIIGRPQADLALLQLSQAYEDAAQEVLQRRPPSIAAQLDDGLA